MDKDKLFELGEVVSTPGVIDTFSEGFLVISLSRHMTGDWGNLCEEDKYSNQYALVHNLRLFSSYALGEDKLWIITEADRSATTLLLPEEY